MRHLSSLLIILSCSIACVNCQNSPKNTIVKNFEKSYKEQKNSNDSPEYTEHFDPKTNIYSNYKYRVAFDAPNHWKTDSGLSKHTIFRSYEPDSAITFAINVIALKEAPNDDIWDLYLKNTEEMDYAVKNLIPQQYNTTAIDFEANRTYIKNRVTLKTKFKYLVKELNIEYYNTTIVYQTFVDNYIYTFSHDIPTMFYQKNSQHHDNMIRNVSFLLGTNFD